MTKLIATVVLALSLCGLAVGKDSADATQELAGMLHNFLDGAAKGDKAAFELFFAEDVIYTRAVGVVLDRATILKDVTAPKPGEPVVHYDAEDIVVHQKGDVAVVKFRLVVVADDQGKQKKTNYRNTGTFLKQDGQWKVIAWQATPIVESKP